jgi:hypothetical protein
VGRVHIRDPQIGLGVLHALALCEATLDDALCLVQVQRLDQVVGGPALHGLDGPTHVRVPRKDDHGGLVTMLAEVRQELEARHPGHLHVREDQIRIELLDLVHGRGGRLGCQNLVTQLREMGSEGLSQRFLVLRYKKARRLHWFRPPFHDKANTPGSQNALHGHGLIAAHPSGGAADALIGTKAMPRSRESALPGTFPEYFLKSRGFRASRPPSRERCFPGECGKVWEASATSSNDTKALGRDDFGPHM